MNIAAIAENYGRLTSALANPAEVKRFRKWLLRYEFPLDKLPTAPDSALGPDWSAVSPDNDGGICARWFLSGNDAIGIPLDNTTTTGFRVPYLVLDSFPIIHLSAKNLT